MSQTQDVSAVRKGDDPLTVAAVAVVAFIIADIAHECIGHGIGFLLAGGRSGVLTTTRLISPQRLGDRGGDLFDLGGPAGNLACAVLAWATLRVMRGPAARARLLLWLVMNFSLFWAFGYLIFSGLLNRGDWLALTRGLPYSSWWRILFVIVGGFLYSFAIGLGASEAPYWLPADRPRSQRLVWIAYLAGGCISTVGAALDPRGWLEMLNSGALVSFAGALGLLRIPRRMIPSGGPSQVMIYRSFGWIFAASALALFYIAILGPGIPFDFR